MLASRHAPVAAAARRRPARGGWRLAALAALLGAAACGGARGADGGAGAAGAGAPPESMIAPAELDTVTLATPTGTLYGTLQLPEGPRPVPVVLLHAGSGPTDREGRSAAGTDNYFTQLADSLAARGIGSLRYDKRGVGESRAAAGREEDIRFRTFVDDAAAWVRQLRADPRVGRLTLAGHSEGALVLALAQQQAPGDAYVSIAGAGRPAGVLIREQLARQLGPELVAQADSALAMLERGETVENPPPLLVQLFRPSVQPYLMSWLPLDPAAAVAAIEVPVTIVQGTADAQVSVADARRLAEARPDAELVLLEGVNHVLKPAPDGGPLAGYNRPDLPISSALVEAVARAARAEGR